jgi:hypothetical protein
MKAKHFPFIVEEKILWYKQWLKINRAKINDSG